MQIGRRRAPAPAVFLRHLEEPAAELRGAVEIRIDGKPACCAAVTKAWLSGLVYGRSATLSGPSAPWNSSCRRSSPSPFSHRLRMSPPVTLIPDRDGGGARRMLGWPRGGTRGSLSQPRSLALGPKRAFRFALGVPFRTVGHLGPSYVGVDLAPRCAAVWLCAVRASISHGRRTAERKRHRSYG